MKLQRCLAILLLSFAMTLVQAAPDTAASDTDAGQAPVMTQQDESDSARDSIAGSDDAVGDLLLQAMSLLGVAYRFGGNLPENGLDCSGFIRYIFQTSLSVNLPRTAAGMAKIGRSVNKTELTPGDLVFFNTRGFNYSHVGLYMGNSKFIHAPRTGKNIEVANMSQSYWAARYNGARRVNRTTAFLSADMSNDSKPVSLKKNNVRTAPVKQCVKGKKCKHTAQTPKSAKVKKSTVGSKKQYKATKKQKSAKGTKKNTTRKTKKN